MNKLFSYITQVPASQKNISGDSGSTGLIQLVILTQLALLCWLVNRYAVEEYLGLPELLPVVLTGFIIHSLLPFKYRLPFFLLLGIGAAFWLLNWVPAFLTLALIALFFGILQLPFSVKLRGFIILLAGGALAALWIFNPQIIPEAYKVVPIVGSMFMFRSSVYLYEIRFEKTPAPLQQQLAYFLLLPNLILTLFPVVDYKAFRKTYYDRAPLEIYQKGVRWMIRGFCHLMLYRIVYYYLQPNVLEVESLGQISFYFLTTYLLMIRLSGLFHTSAGILGLFGFNLPALFQNYYLASGFSDIWRRINTYWRDYVMKILYYPIYFQLRKHGKQFGMVLTILIVFLVSWLLHSYQWFWLKGTFPIRSVDAVFWMGFGGLVAINSVLQQRALNKKKTTPTRSLNHKTFIRALQVVGMFSFMAVFWTLWSSPSLSAWWNLILKALQASADEWLQLAMWMGGLLVAAFIGFRIFEIPQVKAFLEPDEGKMLSVFWGGLTLALFALLTIPAFLNLFQSFTEKPVEHVFETRLNEQDDADMIRGYYEDLLIANQLSSPLADMQNRPATWIKFAESEAAKPTNDWRLFDFKPSTQSILKEATLTTNQHGMRDKEYAQSIPAGIIRFGILGGSYVAGSGVNDDEVFEAICEEKLNAQQPFNKKYELLNFAVPAYHLLHNVYQFDENVPDFELDGLILVSHGVDVARMRDCINRNYSNGFGIPFDFLQTIENEENLKLNGRSEMDFTFQIEKAKRMVDASYGYIAEKSREKGILPIVLFWPRTASDNIAEHKDFLLETARKYEYVILDLGSTYNGIDPQEIQLANWDKHPNTLGHQKVAQDLYEALLSHPEIIRLIEGK